MTKERHHKVLDIKHLTDSTFVLRFERKNIKFDSGQHIGVGPDDGIHLREYSIYSAEKDDFIEILVKEVIGGEVSPILSKLKKGDNVTVDEPVGDFLLNEDNLHKAHIFIASGTGVAPFRSFAKTYESLNCKLIHGVRVAEEAYSIEDFSKGNHILCTSQDENGNFNGRVTGYLQEYPQDKEAMYYLCGNSNMIHEVYDILETQGVSSDNIQAEVYF